MEPWNLLDLGFRFGNRVQQNNDSHVNGAEKLGGSVRLAREQCESLFCCIDFQNRFGGDGRSWAPWTLRFLVFPFGNRVQQNNDSHVNGARKVRGSLALAREQSESLFCCIDFPNRFEGHGRSWASWTSNFLDFPFGNRVQQNNDSHHYGAERVRRSLKLARE